MPRSGDLPALQVMSVVFQVALLAHRYRKRGKFNVKNPSSKNQRENSSLLASSDGNFLSGRVAAHGLRHHGLRHRGGLRRRREVLHLVAEEGKQSSSQAVKKI